jgi:hypothetical protein
MDNQNENKKLTLDKRSYLPPALNDHGGLIRLTKGEGGDKFEEGEAILWGDLTGQGYLPPRQ